MRADGRGHWPAGRRRHVIDEKRLAAAMGELAALLKLRLEWGIISRRALAAHLGVSERTVRRWLAGEDYPPARMLGRIEAWTRRQADQSRAGGSGRSAASKRQSR